MLKGAGSSHKRIQSFDINSPVQKKASLTFAREKGTLEMTSERFLLPKTEAYLSGEHLRWISPTVRGVSQRCSHIAAPPDKSVLAGSFPWQIMVSVCLPDPLLSPTAPTFQYLALFASGECSSRSHTHTPSTHPLLSLPSPPSSLLTFDPRLHRTSRRMWAEGRREATTKL